VAPEPRTGGDAALASPWLVDVVTPRSAAALASAAAHHAYPGHHVQRLYQSGNPRPLRRHFGTRIFDEGWACYAEELLRESGVDAELELWLRARRLRRAAGLAIDVGLHTGRFGIPEALELLEARAGLTPAEARDEVDAVLARPGRHLGQLALYAILELREGLRIREGDGFELASFHERLLLAGSLPPPLMREAVLSRRVPPRHH
jgi:uncharacterized protein (DUF885 family)